MDKGGQMQGRPNRVLRAQRLQRGWTQDDLATALQDLVEWLGEARPVIEGNLVGKWERGIRTPGNYYGPRLCLLFELPPGGWDFVRLLGY
jgi:transcriptional regulator with XRE-family HTH domain